MRLTDATAADRDALRRALRSVAPLSDADLAALPAPRRLALARGEAFLRAGERAHRCGVLVEGALREYYVLADGSERTKGFNLPGDFAGSLADLLSGEPSHAFVAAEQDSVVLVTSWAAYERLVRARKGWADFARLVAERLYRAKAQREYELLALDAATRYRLALARWPQLEALYPQRPIASYGGVTPVPLSRLRAAARRSGGRKG